MSEKWKDIPSYDGFYQVSNFGRVRSWRVKNGRSDEKTRTPRILKQRVQNSGYLYVGLSYTGLRMRIVHRLVAEAFIPNPESKTTVNHKNGDKTDNHVSNLEWSTRSENQTHAFKSGLQKAIKGEANLASKVTEEDVLDMRAAYALGCFSQREIGDAYGLCQQSVHDIIHYINWSHV